MELLWTCHLLKQLPLCLFLLIVSWSIGKGRNIYEKEQDPQMFEMHHQPTLEYEQFRRRIKKNVMDFWQLLVSELDEIHEPVCEYAPDLTVRIVSVIELARDLRTALLSDLERLRSADGYEAWREREAAELSELMQLRLHHLQNPKDCDTASKIGFHLHGYVSFGRALHTFVHRFIIAYATNRTLIASSRGWCYTQHNSWENEFLPFSDTCTDYNASSYGFWRRQKHPQMLLISCFDPLHPEAPFFPRTLPADLAPRLRRLHGNPFSWWVGQFLKYILLPPNQMANMVEEIAERRGFERPFVGVHIRSMEEVTIGRMEMVRKLLHPPVEKYMAEVENYYQVLELTQDVPVRRIYLATDDPDIISEMETKYRNEYEIFSNCAIARSAAYYNRCNHISLMGVTIDIFFLALADYLVCSFTSNLCRAAYEIMQIFHADASDKAYSIDTKYYYEYELGRNLTTLYPHYSENPGEISFHKGEEITDIYDLDNGYSTGVNVRNKQAGWYPSFKIGEKLRTYDFPTYPDITVRRKRKK